MTSTPTETTWASNATLHGIADALRDANHVAIFTHAKPDGDAVGSSLALARALLRLGKRATPVFIDPWPERFDRIVNSTPVHHAAATDFDPTPVADADAIVIVDTGAWSQVGAAGAYIRSRLDHCIVIDHHAHGDADIAPTRYIDPAASAAAEPIASLCRDLLGLPGFADLPADIAEPLYMGVASDTGWFRFPNTSANTLRLAADLIEAGVNSDRVYQISEQADSPARLLLMRRALDSLQFHNNHQVAIMAISLADFAETGAGDDEAGGLVDLPKAVGDTRVVALVTEVGPNLAKVSLRSKAGEQFVDVNQVAQLFKGGGHVHAAGARIHAPLTDAVAQLADVLVRATN